MNDLVSDIAITGYAPLVAQTRITLATIDGALLRCLRDHETSIRVLSPLERFTDVDPNYRFIGDESCLLGLFNPTKNHIVLRDISGAVQAHEIFHLMDWRLGDSKQYRSSVDSAINAAYRRHQKDGMFISKYSSLQVVEFAAELARSLLGYSMSKTISGKSDADRIRRIDPDAAAAITVMIDELRAKYGSPAAPPSCVSTAAP